MILARLEIKTGRAESPNSHEWNGNSAINIAQQQLPEVIYTRLLTGRFNL